MHDPSLLYWHILQTIFVYTPRTFALLVKKFNGDIKKLWDAATLSDFLAAEGTHAQWQIFTTRHQALQTTTLPLQTNLYTWYDARYPPLLKEITDPPMMLYVQGEFPQHPACAVVGTRHPTPYGRHTTRKFVSALVHAGVTIISGLAYGIDTEAHQGALDAKGTTVAVLGSSLDLLYPQVNRHLAQTITKNGALITEYPPGTQSLPQHFPQRNRIIAGLSQAVLVIEATIGSGSRITARYGLEQNREVFAVPGDITLETSAGCNELIRTAGAQLVTKPEQILEALNIPTGQQQLQLTPTGHTQDLNTQIIHTLKKAPYSTADLANVLKVSVIKIQQTLSYLEIEGRIKQTQPGYFTPL